MKVSKGFIIKEPWATLILSGKKTWEIRGSNCKIRGSVGLICQGKWVGNVDIIDCKKLSHSEYKKNITKHQVKDTTTMPYPKTHAWIIGKVKKFKTPKKYVHKAGCVIWVNLDF